MISNFERLAISAVLVLALTAGGLAGQSTAPGSGSGQAPSDKKSGAPQIKATDSIVVGAHLTPEEQEDGKINDAYQPLYHLSRQTDCDQIVRLDQETIIPMAEASKFSVTRNKFLFLANRDIAGCELRAGKYQEAEQRYEKLFEYIPIWPGMDDSDYPQNYQAIGTARLMQGRAKDAEELLEKAIQIFDEQIQKALQSDSEFMRKEHSNNLKMSEAQTRRVLGAAYFRDGRQSDGMDMLERAYQEALQSNADSQTIMRIIETGHAAAEILGDSAVKEKWDQRSEAQKKRQP